MGLLSSEKYDFDGIGAASAAAVMVVLAANPTTAWLTVGFPGKITFWILSSLFNKLASKGVVLLNVGADRLATAVEKSGFDGSWENAYKLMDEIRTVGRDMTLEEITAIDDAVIEKFRRFAKLTRKKPQA
jgi:hypothetical protein